MKISKFASFSLDKFSSSTECKKPHFSTSSRFWEKGGGRKKKKTRDSAQALKTSTPGVKSINPDRDDCDRELKLLYNVIVIIYKFCSGNMFVFMRLQFFHVCDLVLGHMTMRFHNNVVLFNSNKFCFDTILVRLKTQFFALCDLGQGHMTLEFQKKLPLVNTNNFCFDRFLVRWKIQKFTFFDQGQGHMTLKFCTMNLCVIIYNFCFDNIPVLRKFQFSGHVTKVKVTWPWLINHSVQLCKGKCFAHKTFSAPGLLSWCCLSC